MYAEYYGERLLAAKTILLPQEKRTQKTAFVERGGKKVNRAKSGAKEEESQVGGGRGEEWWFHPAEK